MTEQKWTPDTKEAIRNIIRATISSGGGVRPEDLPHLVRTRLKGQIEGDVDVDSYVNSVLADMKKAGEF